ncbi:MAG: SIS domain-containing protein [Candidatus Altiarchaeota archaeon]|nr:SIS domain-containing protein [Candidatus Altiarchaeota archaeon]
MDAQSYWMDYVQELEKSVGKIPAAKFNEIAETLLEARRSGKQVFIMGNGGSASTASHMACDLGKGDAIPGKLRFKAICLSDNIPLLTAWANDTAYDMVFAEQLENFVREGDVVIAISGSGNSQNVLNALKLARERKAKTVGFTGFMGGKMKDLCDICMIVPSDSMQRIEDAHLIFEHALSLYLRKRIGEENV